MATAAEISDQLKNISNELAWLALLFHVFILLFLILLFKGLRMKKRLLGILLSLPLLSVSLIAWMYGNPFNGIVFLGFFLLLFFFSLSSKEGFSETTRGWQFAAAVVMIGLGWFYPHFLDRSYLYLFAAPTGLIPCPTLSLVIGFALLFNGLNSCRWSITLAVISLFYGLFGAFKLHVFIDIVLTAGAVALFVQVVRQRKAI